MVPRTVVPKAVASARNRVFQATPQLAPPPRQPRFQIRGSPIRWKMASGDHCPASVRKAPESALATGKAMNRPSRAKQVVTAAATNRSPRKKPRRASPKAKMTVSASSATKAPTPMPNWLTLSSPKAVLRKSNDQPRAPIAKPQIPSPSKPPSPPPSSQKLCVRPGGAKKPTAAKPSPSSPSSSHDRPCANICTIALAVSAPPRICGRA